MGRTPFGLASQAHGLLLALVGIGLHGFTDGLALGHGHEHAGEYMLPWAVILHRLPVGLMVWFLLRPVYGVRLDARLVKRRWGIGSCFDLFLARSYT